MARPRKGIAPCRKALLAIMSSARKPLKKGSLDVKKIKPKRYHAYNVVLFIFGTLFPPLAVAARFGLGSDFWLNLLLTILGYIPGHAHNFYIQNIRNNKNHRRTPKWAIRYGLVDDSDIRRKQKRSQWANRYNERLPQSTLEGAPYEEGQDPGSRDSVVETARRTGTGQLWNANDEEFYGTDSRNRSTASLPNDASSGGRWHYPANFEDTEASSGTLPTKKKKKDRWELSEDAHRGTLDEEYQRKKKKKKRSKRTEELPPLDRAESVASVPEGPEDAVGGAYGPSRSQRPAGGTTANVQQRGDDELFNHQF
ncbi:hypothetical protein BKA62DRAFT_684458 [Auriculariales sp. MPI-PUGE-AT-0066]|nr:hypothetical protein BKA62DRAFT_684458 [Auriculariales sp. MPI-PUGE-AT-0066]